MNNNNNNNNNDSIIHYHEDVLTFNENDGAFIEGLSVSLGTFIGQLARNSPSSQGNKKGQYFTVLGIKGILDTSDMSSGSQLLYLLQRLNDDKTDDTPMFTMEILNSLLQSWKSQVSLSNPQADVSYEQQLKENAVD